MKKEIIKNLLSKYGKNKVKVVDYISNERAGISSNKDYKVGNEYRKYISKNTKIRLEITNIKSGSDFDFCNYIVYNDDIEVKKFNDVAFTQKAFINFHNKIFKEFGAYKVDGNILKKMSNYDYTKDQFYISTK